MPLMKLILRGWAIGKTHTHTHTHTHLCIYRDVQTTSITTHPLIHFYLHILYTHTHTQALASPPYPSPQNTHRHTGRHRLMCLSVCVYVYVYVNQSTIPKNVCSSSNKGTVLRWCVYNCMCVYVCMYICMHVCLHISVREMRWTTKEMKINRCLCPVLAHSSLLRFFCVCLCVQDTVFQTGLLMPNHA